MKTETVRIKEFKVLKDFTADIQGNHILIMGDNGVGKSSLMQFIQIALGKTTNIPVNATGEGELVVNKNGQKFTFHVKFKDGKPNVTVISPEGIKDTRRGTIAGLVGAIDFDIDKFVELSKTKAGRKEQVDIYKRFLPSDVIEFMDKMELKIKNTYDDRTALNRDIKNLEGSINLHPLINEISIIDTFKKINIDDAFAELKNANEVNDKIKGVESGIEQRKKELEDLKNKIAELTLKCESVSSEIEKGNAWLSKNKKIDISAIEHKIQSATPINTKADQAEQLMSELTKVRKLREQVGEMTALIESSKQAIIETIQQIDSPVDGLTYDDEGLYWNGIAVTPDNLSTSEIIELGVRLKMCENPELGMLFIEHGESIGTERLKIIKDIADKAGWQILMEQVERGNKNIHIEILAE